jgi:hypothetical protein
VFSKAPKLLDGTTMIRPVNPERRASIAERDVSLSPRITKVLGSITCLFRNFFLLKAGMCSGTVSSIYSFLILTLKVLRFLRFGPLSAWPLLIS